MLKNGCCFCKRIKRLIFYKMKTLLMNTLITIYGSGQYNPYTVELNVIVTSAKNKTVLKNVVAIVDGNLLNQITVNKKEEFEFSIRKNIELEITFIAKGYIPKTILLQAILNTVNDLK
ncbi:MAG: hypothetical protein HRT73_02770 [Flavobacteriales bacterium]|nr:hypothetical protein [Flavobacteriales bacterium]